MKKVDDFNAADRIDAKLLENSVHFLSGEINEENVSECIKWLVFENLDTSKHRTLTLYVNSSGGDVYQAFALIDIMRNSTHTIRTIGIGNVMSAAFLIFTSGTHGQRYIAVNTGIMCHQFSGSTDAKFHDLKAEMKENELLNKKMIDILKVATGMVPSKIKAKLLPASDVYLTAQEALDLGVADHLL